MQMPKKSQKKKGKSMPEPLPKDFLDMIAPAAVKFNTDHFILGNAYHCVMAVRGYSTITEELALLSREAADPYETEKVKNRFEANTLFGELNVMNKAMNLGFYEMLGDLPLINRETELYRSLTPDELIEFSRATFRTENSSTLIYKAKK